MVCMHWESFTQWVDDSGYCSEPNCPSEANDKQSMARDLVDLQSAFIEVLEDVPSLNGEGSTITSSSDPPSKEQRSTSLTSDSQDAPSVFSSTHSKKKPHTSLEQNDNTVSPAPAADGCKDSANPLPGTHSELKGKKAVHVTSARVINKPSDEAGPSAAHGTVGDPAMSPKQGPSSPEGPVGRSVNTQGIETKMPACMQNGFIELGQRALPKHTGYLCARALGAVTPAPGDEFEAYLTRSLPANAAPRAPNPIPWQHRMIDVSAAAWTLPGHLRNPKPGTLRPINPQDAGEGPSNRVPGRGLDNETIYHWIAAVTAPSTAATTATNQSNTLKDMYRYIRSVYQHCKKRVSRLLRIGREKFSRNSAREDLEEPFLDEYPMRNMTFRQAMDNIENHDMAYRPLPARHATEGGDWLAPLEDDNERGAMQAYHRGMKSIAEA